MIQITLEKIIKDDERSGQMKKYIITAAQKCATPNREFLKTLDNYAKENGVDEILVLPMAGSSKKEDTLHPYIIEQDYKIITNDYNLNKKIKTSNFEIRPQQINPTTGIARFAKSDISTIFASPKQVYKVIPSHGHNIPKVLLTTGACTHPNYNLDTRIGRIAEKDHQYGAIYVETGKGQEYHFRHLEAQKNGKFIDLDKEYSEKGSSQINPEFLVLGDLHVGDTNKKVERANHELIASYNPRSLFIHDLFNGHSISHHDVGKVVTRARKPFSLNLEKEVKAVHDVLWEYSRSMGDKNTIYIVKSNHDEVLDRYLEEVRFIDEPQNAHFASKILTAMIEGYDPLEYAISLVGDIPANVRFLERDESINIRGFELGNHGDKGANGARGSIRSIENAYGKSVTAHKHTPEKIRDTYIVGTSTNLKLDYNVGLSSWMNTHCMGYRNGKAQLINIIDGKYRL